MKMHEKKKGAGEICGLKTLRPIPEIWTPLLDAVLSVAPLLLWLLNPYSLNPR